MLLAAGLFGFLASRSIDTAFAAPCATPGTDGPGGTLTGTVNTYYPGTANAAAAAAAISVGASRGAATAIAAGDLLLVVQMQDAAINSTDTDSYGNGVAGGVASGVTSLNNSGKFEYVRATSAVAAGSVGISGAGAGSGLVNSYTNAVATAAQGQRRFQVIRVPQYSTATLGSGLTAAAWDGTSGGVLAVDVTGTLALGGASVNVTGLGFRGGGARQLTGAGGGSNNAYRSLATANYHAQKGEGIAGTPRYVRNGVAAGTDTGVEGYPNGSSARGAPGTAGGGGTDGDPPANDENSGGGGGANGGTGGQGGNTWSSNLARGGDGGTAYAGSVSQLVLGSGGGAGTRNNSPSIPAASAGGNGGGLVMVRAGNLTGTATITADGQSGVVPENDAGGGGGAGGSVMVLSAGGGTGGLTVNAGGAVGGDAEQATSGSHGPGGGGGGGVVVLSGAAAAVNVAGGGAGDTNNGSGTFIAYGATAGSNGTSTTSATLPGVPGVSAGTECTPQLTVTKSTSTPVVVDSGSGGTATYTITVANAAGRAAATNTSISDALPLGFTFASTTSVTLGGGATRPATSNPSVGSATPAWGSFTIPGGGQVQVTFTTTVAAGTTPGTYQNPATTTYTDPARAVAGGTTAASYAPASSTNEDVQVRLPIADVAVTKTVSNATPALNANVTFTVTVTSNGPELARTVSVADALPAGLTFVSATPSAGAYNSGTGVWTVGNLANGANATLRLVATVTTHILLTNTATASTTSTDSVAANNSASATVNVPDANLAVTKTVSNATPALNANVTFTVTVTSNGPELARAVSVADALPAGLTFVSATPSVGTYNAGTGVWTVGNRANGASATLSLVATVTAYTAITNTATASSSTYDPMPANNAASATVNVPDANLAVTKTINDPTPEIASNVTFTVTVTNGGPDTAQAVAVADALPAGLAFVSSSASVGSYNSGTGTWTVGNLANGASATLSIVATVTAPGAITNNASASASTYDPAAGNNAASASVNARQAELAVAKTVSNATPALGSNVTFTVTVMNGGPNAAQSVSVADALPAGLALVSATPSVGSYAGGVWTVGNLANGASATLQLLAQVTSHLAITNRATASSSTYDPASGNNSASASVNVPDADLAVTTTVDNLTPAINTNVTFTVTLTNSGPNASAGVTVGDALPAGLTLVSATPSVGTYGLGVWNAGTVANGATETLVIVATVTGHTQITNTATVTAGTFDPVSANNAASASVDVPDANLAVTKTVNNAEPAINTNVTFTVTVTNNGPDSAQNVAVGDALPAGLTFVSATPSKGTYSSGTGVWTVGNLANGASGSLAIVATVTAHTAVTNTASASSTTYDPVPGNDSASATVNVPDANVSVTKVVDVANPDVGANVTFTVTVANAGPDTAQAVTVTDVVPAGLALVSSTPSTGSYNNGTGIWAVGNLANGASATLTLVATATSHTAVTNTATATSSTYDPVPASNSASAVVDAKDADLAVTKVVDNATPAVGANVTFTVTVTNTGPNTAQAVSVADALPSGLTLVSATTATGTYSSGTGTWTVGALANGASATLSLVATVTVPTSRTNIATVTSAIFDPASANNTASASVDARDADLAITKTVNDPTPSFGGQVTFLVTVTNNGPDSAAQVSVADALPAGLTLVTANPSSGSYAAGTWNVGTLANGTTATLLIDARVTVHTPVTNTATATSPTHDPDPANNSAAIGVDVPNADVSISKTVDITAPALNGNVTFTITVTSSGPDTAAGVSVADPLPAGLTLVSAAPSTGSYGAGVWTIGALANGASETLAIVARVTAYSPLTNTATVSATTFDPVSANDSGSASLDVPDADLALTKVVDNPSPSVGANVTFTITVSNGGPNAGTATVVADALPAGLTFVSANPSVGTYDSGTGTWSVGLLANGAAATLDIVAQVTTPGGVTNTATATAAEHDPDPSNNTASASVAGVQADLAVTKTVNDPTPSLGSNVTFSVAVRNNGPDTAALVRVDDLLPAGLTFVSAAPSVGAYNPGTGVWTVGDLANGVTRTIAIVARVIVTTPITNGASGSSPTFDPTPANNADAATVDVQNADIAIVKLVDTPAPSMNGTVTYSVTATNNGPDTATGVAVDDQLPAGLTLLSATPSVGTYASATGVWTIGTLANGAAANLTVVARVTTHTPITNTASVTSATFDAIAANDSGSVIVDVPDADLSVTKTVDNAAPAFGANVTFTITVANAGPDAAAGVSVADPLPAGLTYVSSNPSTGSYVSGTGVWTIGALANGATATLDMVAAVTTANSVTNTATLSAGTYDPVGPATASATVDVPQADLAVTKTVDDPTPPFGGNVTFTVVVTNRGSDPAAGVAVADVLPVGLNLVSTNPSAGTYGSGTWTIGALASGTSETLQVVARVVTGNQVTNTATASATTFDPNPANNADSASVDVANADLAVTKTVDDATPNLGGTVHFTIAVTNNGPDATSGVRVADTLPAGLSLTGATPSVGSYSGGVWTVGALANGAGATLDVAATVTSSAPITNTATVSSDAVDANPANDTRSASVDAPDADLAVIKSVDDPAPPLNGTVTFLVTVTNNGPDAAPAVRVADALPSGLTLLSATPSAGSYAGGTWTVGTMTNGATETLSVDARVTSSALITNTATVTSGAGDATPANDTGSASVDVPEADLAVTKTVDNPAPALNSNVTFSVTVTNNGPNPAFGVVVADALPSGLTLVGASPSVGAYSSGTWTVGGLASGATATLDVTATVTSAAAITNTATVSSASFDGTPANDTAAATVDVPEADLRIQKTVSDPTPAMNGNVTFTLTVTNNGPSLAQSVQVTDTLPAGLAFVSASSPSYVGNVWSVGDLTNGATATLDIVAQVTNPAPITNSATVTSSTLDPASGNNTDSAQVDVPEADLRLTKTVDDATPNEGQDITYTLTLTNNGPNGASAVAVTDLLPVGVTFVSATPQAGTFNAGVWSLVSVPSGATRRLQIVATVAAQGIITNAAEVTSSGTFDPTSTPADGLGDDFATVDIDALPPAADLSLAKTASSATPAVGGTVTYTLTVQNNGPSATDNVSVIDLLPAGVTYVSSTATQGTYDAGVGTWTVGAMPATATARLDIVVTVDQTGVIVNTAEVGTSDAADPDSTPANAVPGEDDQASVQIDAQGGAPASADLEIVKSASSPVAKLGDTISYAIIVTNRGPATATNVRVLEQLPPPLQFVLARASVGSYDLTSGVWSIPAIANGASASLIVTTHVVASGSVTNTVQILSSDQPDPDGPFNPTPGGPGGEQSSATVSVAAPTPTPTRLRITKSGPKVVKAGGTVTFTVVVRNSGSVPATAVQMTDCVPTGLSLRGKLTTGKLLKGRLAWQLGTLQPGQSRTIRVRYRVDRDTRGLRGCAAVAWGKNTLPVSAQARVRVVAGASRPTHTPVAG